jgi:ferritin-like protein
MKQVTSVTKGTSRRSFLRSGLVSAGAATLSATVLGQELSAFDQADAREGPPITEGDVAILQFLAAAELIERDLWQQYNELAGVDAAPSGYVAALSVLDGDMSQYISDNTDDEISHATFLNAYLASKGAPTIDLEEFRRLPSSQAPGAAQIGRLTNLMQLTVDTSWWTQYRSTNNPDLGGAFPPLIPSLNKGQHTAIPRNDAELGDPNNISDHVQAIANTAAFHFAFIEEGGSSLYPTLAQKVSNLEVLRILLSIGPTETAHFQTWHDKAGNAPRVTDGSLVFPDLNAPAFQGEDLKKNLIMPEPCQFISEKLPPCSIIRPTATRRGGAVATIEGFRRDGLFLGQGNDFIQLLLTLAAAADQARREF